MDRLLLREIACLCKCNCTRELSHMPPNDSPFSKSRGLESGNGSTRRTCIIARSTLITSETRSVYKRAMSNKAKWMIYINCYSFPRYKKNLYQTDRWKDCLSFHGANYRYWMIWVEVCNIIIVHLYKYVISLSCIYTYIIYRLIIHIHITCKWQ